MRLMQRNKQPIWYANYESKEEIIDEYGNSTGSYEIKYTKPKRAMWNVGVIDSDTEVEMYGLNAQDVIRIVADKKNFPLNETSVIWYGVTPTLKDDGVTYTPYNYNKIVIRSTLNTVTVYAQRVDIS